MKSYCLYALFVTTLFSTAASAFGSPIEEVDPQTVRQCMFIAQFKGPDGYRMVGTPAVMNGFKNRAMEEAQHLGATHITWSHAETLLTDRIIGSAYKCDTNHIVAEQ